MTLYLWFMPQAFAFVSMIYSSLTTCAIPRRVTLDIRGNVDAPWNVTALKIAGRCRGAGAGQNPIAP